MSTIVLAALVAPGCVSPGKIGATFGEEPGEQGAQIDAGVAEDVQPDAEAPVQGEGDAASEGEPPEPDQPEVEPPEADPPAPECLESMAACGADTDCCAGLDCGTTTLGQVCCGQDDAPCATANGEDCCGELLCVDGRCQDGASMFKAPFACGQTWTYDHHAAEVREALDFIRDDGGETDGAPAVASAGGWATQHWEAGGAGNYIVIDHSGGWQTYYFHLWDFTVADGTQVTQGQQIGTTGSTGNSSGPHIHYEQLYGGVGQTIRLNGESLAPYPAYYFERSYTSDNCP